jgi:phosphotransferase system HPr (HPr) family protein
LARFVQTAGKFLSRITLNVDGRIINAKSIMGIISLNLQGGQTVRIVADGEDEQTAVHEMEQLLSATEKSE